MYIYQVDDKEVYILILKKYKFLMIKQMHIMKLDGDNLTKYYSTDNA